MFISIDKYVDTLYRLNISANQFLLCYLLYVDEKVDGKYIQKGKGLANLYKYSSKKDIKWSKEEVKNLVDKGFLEDPHYNKDLTYPDHLVVTDKFVSAIFAAKSRFDQFNEVYPNLIDNFNNPNGPMIKLKVCDIDEMETLYNRKVKTKMLHEEILEIVEWAKENKQLNTSMENFIRGNLWLTYKEEMSKFNHQMNMRAAK